MRLLTRLRFGFSYILEHKFKHNFACSINLLCSVLILWKLSLHVIFLMQYNFCQNYTTIRRILLTEVKNVNDAIMYLNKNDLLHVIMHGNKNFNNNMNIRTSAIKFSKDSERFDQPLFKDSYFFIHNCFKLFCLWSLLYYS